VSKLQMLLTGACISTGLSEAVPSLLPCLHVHTRDACVPIHGLANDVHCS